MSAENKGLWTAEEINISYANNFAKDYKLSVRWIMYTKRAKFQVLGFVEPLSGLVIKLRVAIKKYSLESTTKETLKEVEQLNWNS